MEWNWEKMELAEWSWFWWIGVLPNRPLRLLPIIFYSVWVFNVDFL